MIRLSAHLGTLFTELGPLERPAAARAAGFTAVETWWPPAASSEEWIDAVTEARVRAVLVNADGGDLSAGDRGFCNVPGRGDDAVRAAVAAARVVRACGGEAINLLVGRLDRGRTSGRQLDLARSVVREAADEVARLGARIVIEHLNDRDVQAPLLPTPMDALAFVRSVRHDGVTVLVDAYHAAKAGLDPLAEVARVGPLIGHAQFADCPGRGAPGTGELDLDDFLDALDRVGYAGHVGLEFMPSGPTEHALRTLGDLVRRT